LLRAAREALPDGGRVLIAEPMAGTPGAEPMGGAYFGFYLFAMGQGRPRTPAELEAMLLEAGFAAVREIATAQPLQTRVLIADVAPATS
jgi:demethylspheroidene O-methyltransferase